eukprot:EC096989.1.p2 GENE.EC096989.1~~EC096989.1.p2  ORF type:complete len:106 (+),score=5.24 EC096989.1:227-544(+)
MTFGQRENSSNQNKKKVGNIFQVMQTSKVLQVVFVENHIINIYKLKYLYIARKCRPGFISKRLISLNCYCFVNMLIWLIMLVEFYLQEDRRCILQVQNVCFCILL